MTLRYDTRSRVSTYTQSWVSNADPDFGVFESIATTTLSSSTASVTFGSIPQTYKHLQIRGIARTDRASTFDGGYVQFNSDTTLSNYTLHILSGTGSAATSEGYSTASGAGLQTPTTGGNTILANTFGSFVMDILDYANTNKYKTIRSIGGFEDNTNARIQLLSGAWLNTAAITSITLDVIQGTNYKQYSSFALYGIKG